MKLSPSKVRAARVARGLRVEDVASMASVSASTIARTESGRTVPSSDSLARIARVLDISMEELFDETAAGTAA